MDAGAAARARDDPDDPHAVRVAPSKIEAARTSELRMALTLRPFPTRHNDYVFYGLEQAAIHHERFGQLSRDASALVLHELDAVGLDSGTVVDLGCGSGIFARLLTDAGYDVVGVDISEEMVALARATAPHADLRVGSVHDIALPSDVRAVVALGEVCNYATDAKAGLDAIARLAEKVAAALVPGGVFVFDVATPGRGGPGGNVVRFHDAETWSLVMQGNEHDDVLERAITIFAREPGGDLYHRVDEHHVLRLYTESDVVRTLRDTGFDVDVRAGYDAPAAFPGWRVFVARHGRHG